MSWERASRVFMHYRHPWTALWEPSLEPLNCWHSLTTELRRIPRQSYSTGGTSRAGGTIVALVVLEALVVLIPLVALVLRLIMKSQTH